MSKIQQIENSSEYCDDESDDTHGRQQRFISEVKHTKRSCEKIVNAPKTQVNFRRSDANWYVMRKMAGIISLKSLDHIYWTLIWTSFRLPILLKKCTAKTNTAY